MCSMTGERSPSLQAGKRRIQCSSIPDSIIVCMDLEPLLAFVDLHQIPVGDKFTDKLTDKVPARTRSSQVGFARIAETFQKVPDTSPPNQQGFPIIGLKS